MASVFLIASFALGTLCRIIPVRRGAASGDWAIVAKEGYTADERGHDSAPTVLPTWGDLRA
jgi:hypothetical protein